MKTVFIIFSALLIYTLDRSAEAADAAKYKERILYSFCSQANCADGANPLAGMIDVKGILYGTTTLGGNTSCDNGIGCGVVFSLDPKTGREKVLYTFCSQQNCADGAYPLAGLTAINGMLFGTTSGGANSPCAVGCGTVFSVDPATGAEKKVYAFCSQQNCADGSDPHAGLIALKGKLYGTTDAGGNTNCNGGCGTVFSLDPATGAETVLYDFCSQQKCADGSLPFANLINVRGILYGTTAAGWAYPSCGEDAGCGTVFSLDPSTGSETVVHSFGNGADGKVPTVGLIAVQGTLYGTTLQGGNSGCAQNLGCGTAFSVDLSSDAENALYAFCSQQNCTDGANPDASLSEIKGVLYGTTNAGGDTGCVENLGCGTAFSIDPQTGTEKVLHTFGEDTDGQKPQASLINVDGTLYGTAVGGGAHGYGAIFALRKR